MVPLLHIEPIIGQHLLNWYIIFSSTHILAIKNKLYVRPSRMLTTKTNNKTTHTEIFLPQNSVGTWHLFCQMYLRQLLYWVSLTCPNCQHSNCRVWGLWKVYWEPSTADLITQVAPQSLVSRLCMQQCQIFIVLLRKACNLNSQVISGIFHLKLSDWSWPQVKESQISYRMKLLSYTKCLEMTL